MTNGTVDVDFNEPFVDVEDTARITTAAETSPSTCTTDSRRARDALELGGPSAIQPRVLDDLNTDTADVDSVFDTLRVGKHSKYWLVGDVQPTDAPDRNQMHESISLQRLILLAVVSMIGATARTRRCATHADA